MINSWRMHFLQRRGQSRLVQVLRPDIDKGRFGAGLAPYSKGLFIGAPTWPYGWARGQVQYWEWLGHEFKLADSLLAPDPGGRQGGAFFWTGDRFGASLACTPDAQWLLVGAPNAQAEGEEDFYDRGKVYLHKFHDGRYEQQHVYEGDSRGVHLGSKLHMWNRHWMAEGDPQEMRFLAGCLDDTEATSIQGRRPRFFETGQILKTRYGFVVSEQSRNKVVLSRIPRTDAYSCWAVATLGELVVYSIRSQVYICSPVGRVLHTLRGIYRAEHFGTSLLGGLETLLVGAVNPRRVYVYKLSGGSLILDVLLSSGQKNDFFGKTLALDSRFIYIGAEEDRQANGAVYVYAR